VLPIYRTGVPLPSRCCIIYIFFSINISTEYFQHAAHSPFFSSKCCLFHNATFFGYCIIHILHTGVIKFKCKTRVPKGKNFILIVWMGSLTTGFKCKCGVQRRYLTQYIVAGSYPKREECWELKHSSQNFQLANSFVRFTLERRVKFVKTISRSSFTKQAQLWLAESASIERYCM
jgi:hypothetical protein